MFSHKHEVLKHYFVSSDCDSVKPVNMLTTWLMIS